MLEALAANTRVIVYLMAGIGVLGILAKIVNQVTLVRLVKASGNMPKSTHKLIKLVRAKYEHACMIHDSVENIDAFVEKYIYEYRGFLFRIHTWRQIEILCVWFAGILAALGAFLQYYLYSGFVESVYQYIAAGAAEMVLLSVVMRLSDEPYKIRAVQMYMIDYLENICTFRLRKQTQREREFIDVISGEANSRAAAMKEEGYAAAAEQENAGGRSAVQTSSVRNVQADLVRSEDGRTETGHSQAGRAETARTEAARTEAVRSEQASSSKGTRAGSKLRERAENVLRGQEGGLPIRIEGEPRKAGKGDAARQAVRSAVSEGAVDNDDERPALREEAIRQILEEFLA